MGDEKKKEVAFDPACVNDIYDELNNHSFALRAFGALLKSSDLFEFADGGLWGSGKSDDSPGFHRASLRWGLQQIIELYLVHQERILSEYVDRYDKSDMELVRRARIVVSMIEQGVYKHREVAANNLRETICSLDIVVINMGSDLKAAAEDIKAVCLKYINHFTGREASNAKSS